MDVKLALAMIETSKNMKTANIEAFYDTVLRETAAEAVKKVGLEKSMIEPIYLLFTQSRSNIIEWAYRLIASKAMEKNQEQKETA